VYSGRDLSRVEVVVGPRGRAVVQVPGYWADGPNGVLGSVVHRGISAVGVGQY
jgi:hypothetical protein